MALFAKKEKKTKAKAADAAKSAAVVAAATIPGTAQNLSHILRHARITEKATMHSSDSVYTFDIATSATKQQVIQAVRALYKVTPRMVHVVTVPSKVRRNARTGKIGVKQGGKKAYVYLKKGETITIG